MSRQNRVTARLREMYTNLAFLVMSFQVDWQRYYFSDGHQMFRKRMKETAGKLATYMRKVHVKDPQIYNSKSITYNNSDSEEFVESIVKSLDIWSTNNDVFPQLSEGKDVEFFNFYFKTFYMCEVLYLSKQLKLEVFPSLSQNSIEGTLHTAHIKWNGHINYRVLGLVDDSFLKNISDSDSIVIVADIRHSQDLMTYSLSPELYEKYILRLSENARNIVKKEYGIFERFTGDGFICFFNKYISDQFGLDYYDSALSACLKIKEMSTSIISEWTTKIRKVPSEPIGLAIGIDSGKISYSENGGNLYVIGDACVWATRMCAAGQSDEIIVNNIPYHHLQLTSPLSFKEISAATKDGEKFVAHVLVEESENFIIE